MIGLGRGQRTITATSSVQAADIGLTIVATSGTYDLTATAGATLGTGFHFGFYNEGSGTVTFNPAGAETVRTPAGSVATLAFLQGQGGILEWNGTEWCLLANSGFAPSSGTVISGLATGRIVDAASATTIETAASISTDQNVTTTGTVTSKAAGAGGIRLDTDTSVGDFVGSLSPPPTISATRRWTFPDASATMLGVSGSLTANVLPKRSSTTGILQDSTITDTGSLITLGSASQFLAGAFTGSSTSVPVKVNGVDVTANFQANDTGSAGSFGSFTRFANAVTNAPGFALYKSRGTSVGSYTVVNSGDRLGQITIGGSDGTDFAEAAAIRFEVDGTPGDNDMPGRLVFLVTPDGSATPAEAFRLSNDKAATFSGNITQSGATTRSWGTGVGTHNSTTDATALGTASEVFLGGISIAKNLISAKGIGVGPTSTATAAGTTTLTATSTVFQIFTGSTTQSVTLPAANVFGSGIGYTLILKNESSGTVTINRAGSDTIYNTSSVTSVTATAGMGIILISDGVSKWSVLARV